MVDDVQSRLVAIVTSLRVRPRKTDGAALTDAEIAELPLEKIDIDSLTLLEVMYLVEEDFGIVFGDVAVEDFATLGDVAARVTDLRKRS